MRRIVLICILFCLFILSASSSVVAANESLRDEALKDLQKVVVKAMPTEGNIIRIAVLDLAGDDGTIKNALTSIISEKTTFKIIERADLDKILKEQGLQLKDVMDEKTRIQHGKIKGVQGLLMGNVLGMESGFMSFTIRVHLKLDDVEKGEIVFANDFKATAVSPVRNWVFVALGCIIFALIVTILFKYRRVAVKKTTIKEDVKTRVYTGKGLSGAMATLSDARSKLMDSGRTESAIKLKDTERNLLALKEEIENAVRGDIDMRKSSEFRDALSFDSNFQETSEDLSKSADKLYDAVLSGATDIDASIGKLNRDIRIASDVFRRRKI